MKKFLTFLSIIAFCLIAFESMGASPPSFQKQNAFIQANQSIDQVTKTQMFTANTVFMVEVGTAKSLPMETRYGNIKQTNIIYIQNASSAVSTTLNYYYLYNRQNENMIIYSSFVNYNKKLCLNQVMYKGGYYGGPGDNFNSYRNL